MSRNAPTIPTDASTPAFTTVSSSAGFSAGDLVYQKSNNVGLVASNAVATATFNWTITQSGVIGASAGNSNTISQNLTATTSTIGFVTYSITANEGACQGPVTPITITVNPIPVVAPSTVLQSVCSGSVSPIQLTSNVDG